MCSRIFNAVICFVITSVNIIGSYEPQSLKVNFGLLWFDMKWKSDLSQGSGVERGSNHLITFAMVFLVQIIMFTYHFMKIVGSFI